MNRKCRALAPGKSAVSPKRTTRGFPSSLAFSAAYSSAWFSQARWEACIQ